MLAVYLFFSFVRFLLCFILFSYQIHAHSHTNTPHKNQLYFTYFPTKLSCFNCLSLLYCLYIYVRLFVWYDTCTVSHVRHDRFPFIHIFTHLSIFSSRPLYLYLYFSSLCLSLCHLILYICHVHILTYIYVYSNSLVKLFSIHFCHLFSYPSFILPSRSFVFFFLHLVSL